MPSRILGLRIDVCTFDGLREGAPRLLELLSRRRLRATFFSALGPDRSGLAVLRVFRKRGFLAKMVRTRAGSMYGWRTLLRGTLLPAPRMADRLGDVLRRIAAEGHELGLHGWDHVRWQDRLDALDPAAVRADYAQAREAYEGILGEPPRAAAAPAWLASRASLAAAEALELDYASDVRGTSPFLPALEGLPARTPQIPTTLPTLDEVLGRGGAGPDAFQAEVLRRLRPEALNVLTAHAEAEGRRYLPAFERLLEALEGAGWEVCPLRELLPRGAAALPCSAVQRGIIPGRAGEVSVQSG